MRRFCTIKEVHNITSRGKPAYKRLPTLVPVSESGAFERHLHSVSTVNAEVASLGTRGQLVLTCFWHQVDAVKVDIPGVVRPQRERNDLSRHRQLGVSAPRGVERPVGHAYFGHLKTGKGPPMNPEVTPVRTHVYVRRYAHMYRHIHHTGLFRFPLQKRRALSARPASVPA